MSKKPRKAWRNLVAPWSQATLEQRVLLDAAWRGGHLSFLLTPSQEDSYTKVRKWEAKGEGRVFALDTSRRWGKSVLCLVFAVEDAIRNAGWRIVYCAPTHEMVRKIILPLMAQLTQTCPPELAPEWMKSEGTFVFGNGSRIELVGLDVRPDGARGTGVDRVVLDEAGFFDNLEYLMVSIIYPQMLGRDHARIIAASTPSITPLHYWSMTVVPECINRGAHDKKTLDDASQYSSEEIEFFYSQMPGGREGVAARREYGAEHIADDSLAIVPEFRDAEKAVVRSVDPPVWRDCYVAMDPGFNDLTAVLFGYWDFLEQRLVIEDEFVAPRMNSAELALAIKRKEAQLWAGVRRRSGNGYDTKPQPYMRVCDTDLRLIADLSSDHGLVFIPTQKDNLETQVNQVRVALQHEKIVINPRCKKLALHLRHGVWKKVNKLFEREGGEFGHFDTIAALVYLWRNVQKRRNPTPELERFVCGDLQVANDNAKGRSKWVQESAKARRVGQRFYFKTGKT